MCLSWAAERQNLARDSMMGVAGNPTTTTAIPRFRHSRPKALKHHNTTRLTPIQPYIRHKRSPLQAVFSVFYSASNSALQIIC